MANATEEERARFQAMMALVDRALDLPADERRALLDRECTDPALRAEVDRLLDADSNGDSRLSTPAAAGLVSALSGLVEPSAVVGASGRAVGPFKLISLLGRGGMGEVWLAQRFGADFEQHVAVKLLRGGQGEASALRFRRERQILAKLSHPNIARLLDGGVTDDGQGWLAMEVVRGLPLVQHCVEHQLELDARLSLFVKVCDAVQFAHQNLVVHRDLKPGNVLVDADGVPKLLDFGIAKLLEAEPGESLTEAHERPMTPDYASPEQRRGEAVTTASDGWSLGAMLHELVTGKRIERDATGAPRAWPSAQVDGALKHQLRGDLDAIILKATRPEPHERYGSVDALATDVRRHLEGAPVAARGEATGYLLRSLLRRHRVAVALSLTAVAALAVGVVATVWQARRAEAEARKAQKAEAFVIDLLRTFDPEKGDGQALSQRDILERGEARLGVELADQPIEQARLLRVFAETWLGLASPDRALGPAESALELQQRFLGPRDEEVAKTYFVLSDVQLHLAKFDQAEQAATAAASIALEHEGPRGPTVAAATSQLGSIHCKRSRFAEGQKLLRQAVEIAVAVHGEESTEAMDRRDDLAICLSDEGRYDEGVALNRRNAEISAKVRGPRHPATLLLRHNLAADLTRSGHADEAERILRDVLALQREVFGSDYPLGGTQRMLGLALDAEGKPAEALPLFDEAVRVYAAKEGPESFMADLSRFSRTQALRHLGRVDDARAELDVVLRGHLARFGTDRWTARMQAELGGMLLDLGRAEDARPLLVAALAFLEPRIPLQPYTRQARSDLARADALIAKAR